MYWTFLDYRCVNYRQLLEDFAKNSHGLSLDAGCGHRGGSLSFQASVGIDLSRRNVEISKRQRPATSFVLADLAHLPFKAASFDVVVCVDVLEHVEEKAKVIAEIAKVTNEGSIFIGSTSNLLNPIFIFDTIAPKGVVNVLTEKYAKSHYERHSRFTAASLAKTLEKSGFKTDKLLLLGFPPFSPWIYLNQPELRPPWFSRLWIFFDRFVTKTKPMRLMKEMIVFRAFRQNVSA